MGSKRQLLPSLFVKNIFYKYKFYTVNVDNVLKICEKP